MDKEGHLKDKGKKEYIRPKVESLGIPRGSFPMGQSGCNTGTALSAYGCNPGDSPTCSEGSAGGSCNGGLYATSNYCSTGGSPASTCNMGSQASSDCNFGTTADGSCGGGQSPAQSGYDCQPGSTPAGACNDGNSYGGGSNCGYGSALGFCNNGDTDTTNCGVGASYGN